MTGTHATPYRHSDSNKAVNAGVHTDPIRIDWIRDAASTSPAGSVAVGIGWGFRRGQACAPVVAPGAVWVRGALLQVGARRRRGSWAAPRCAGCR